MEQEQINLIRKKLKKPNNVSFSNSSKADMLKNNSFHWWYAFIGYGAYLLALTISTIVSSATDSLLQGAYFNTGALFNLLSFILAGCICLLTLRIVSRNKLTSYAFALNTDNLGKVIMLGGALGLLFFGMTEVVESKNEALQKAGEQVTQSFNIGSHLLNDFLLLLNIGLVAPIVEEIVFRGAIFNPIVQGLKKYTFIPRWLVLIVALVVSTFAFVSAHGGSGQDAQLGLLALLSIFAALAMYITGSLFAAIAVHAVNNNVVFIYTVIKQPNIELEYFITLTFISLTCLVLCLPLGLLLGRILPNRQ